jgi:two-component system chemotaxis sensor kinase CheA
VDPLAAIKQTFFQECEEQLSELETGLLKIENSDHDSETIGAVFRAVHSIKGGAAAFGFDELVDFVHVFESTLDLLRSGALEPSLAVTNVLLRASDILSDLVRSARDGKTSDSSNIASIKAQLEEICAAGDKSAMAEHPTEDFDFTPLSVSFESIFDSTNDEADAKRQTFEIGFKPRPSLYARANESLRIIRELTLLGNATIRCDKSEIPLLSELDPEGAYLSWKVALQSDAPESAIRRVFEFVEWDCDFELALLADDQSSEQVGAGGESESTVSEVSTSPSVRVEPAVGAPAPMSPQIAPVAEERQERKVDQHALAPQPTIRVDLEKVDRLINLVGELVITQAALAQRVAEAGLSRASSVAIGLDELEQLTRDIQDSVMAIRAQPVKPIFQRMARTVREVATATGKAVKLIVEGEGTEVDKTVIERLTDPLTHMVRNAVDHGIESQEARLAAGKPAEGTLRLAAVHRSGRIIIEVSDDGAGINRARVREIAVSRGLIAADAYLSDDEIDTLIFLPGFSTVAVASSISGRGVGMDVVKQAIQALGGRMSISSRPGRGSTFSLSLPLTLAVLDGMVVTVAGQTLIVPLTAVIETLQPKPGIVHTIGNGVRVIANRKSFIPLVDIGFALRYRAHDVDPTAQVALLIEAESGTKCALLVDAIQGQRQVVIKSLESNYGRVHGVAAATILGDGRVALIVDLDAIVNGLRADPPSAEIGLMAAE